MKRFYHLFFILIFAFLSACSDKGPTIERAFYYWKSGSTSFSSAEINTLSQLKNQLIYLHFFDVAMNKDNQCVPLAKSNLKSINKNEFQNQQFIPVVYVTNQVLKNKSEGFLDTLANKICFLIEKHKKEKFAELDFLNEYQIDCDWTESTQKNYFYLLNKIKELSSKTLSCTLRLYPYKFPNRMGIPPVDRATLMCYNLLEPLNSEGKNAVFNLQELEKYLVNAPETPFTLDVALPIYSWTYLYKNNRFHSILNHPVNTNASYLQKIKQPNWYIVLKDTVLGEELVRQGEVLKIEDVSAANLLKAKELLFKHVKFKENTRFSLYHLDENNLKNYTHETFNQLFTSSH